MHRRRKRVVGRLRHVYAVIRMNGFFLPRWPPANSIARHGYDLVRVQIGLGLTPGLPNAKGKMVIQFAGNDLVCGRHIIESAQTFSPQQFC
jgi:hypothetical protein